VDWFATVKRHYEAGRYDDAAVEKFVVAGKITAEEYETITGETYGGSAT